MPILNGCGCGGQLLVVAGYGVVKPACGAVVLYGIAVLGYVGGCCVSEKKKVHCTQ
jgi:hypothetical protein